MAKYPYPPIKRRINRKEVSILGVQHTDEFYQEHREFYQEFIESQDAIVTEQSVELAIRSKTIARILSKFSSNFFNDIEKDTSVGHPSSDGKDSTKGNYPTPCADEKRDFPRLYRVDPNNANIVGLDLVVGTTGYMIVAMQCWNTVDLLHSFYSRPRKGITRRDLLKILGTATKGAVGIALANGSLICFDDATDPIEYGADDLFAWGNVDYRNIKIASGIEKLCYQVPEEVSGIGLIHGAAHYKTVAFYIDHPLIRYVKEKIYLPYSMLADNSIREYRSEKGRWVLENRVQN